MLVCCTFSISLIFYEILTLQTNASSYVKDMKKHAKEIEVVGFMWLSSAILELDSHEQCVSTGVKVCELNLRDLNSRMHCSTEQFAWITVEFYLISGKKHLCVLSV